MLLQILSILEIFISIQIFLAPENHSTCVFLCISLLSTSFTSIVFNIIGLYSIIKRHKEVIRYYYIGNIFRICLVLISLTLLITFYYLYGLNQYILSLCYSTISIDFLSLLFIFIISYSLQKIFIDNLEKFYAGEGI